MDIRLHKKYQELQESHWWFMVRDNLLMDLVFKNIKKGSLVMDFGCNYGHAVKLLGDKGYESFGVDVSREAVNYGRSININDISLISEKDIQNNSLDAVISMDVLEHIDNDKETLEYIWSKLNPGGLMIVTVPAFMFLWGVQDEISHHFRRYKLSELLYLAGEVGDFEIVKKTYFNSFLFMPVAIIRVLSKLFKLKSRNSDLDINSVFLNKIFFKIFDLERRLLKYINFPFGVSALLVLRKR